MQYSIAMKHPIRAAVSILAVLSTAELARAQATCQPEFLPTFGANAGSARPISAMTVFDDGSGPALLAGGFLTVARWEGTGWVPVGGTVGGDVAALETLDVAGGSGPALYVGGSFNGAGGVIVNKIARLDGESWAPLGSGMNGTVAALTTFDDGRRS